MVESERDEYGGGVLETAAREFSNSSENTRLEESDEFGSATSELRIK